MEPQCCTTILCPGCQLQVPRDPAMDDGQPGGKVPVCWWKTTHATGLPSRKLDAEVRDSSQFEMPPPHMCAPSQLDVTPDTVFELWRRFQTHHTHRTHKWTVPLLLVAPTVLVASVMCYWVHSHLGTLLKCCCIKKQSPTAPGKLPE